MQEEYNEEHGIVPRTIQKALPVMGAEIEELLSGVAGTGESGGKEWLLSHQERGAWIA